MFQLYLGLGLVVLVALALLSGADEISPMTGMELFREKVEKIWMMAGKWDEDEGRENNFARNERARRAAHAFCESCPAPVTFLGWEIGYGVITGGGLEENDHLYKALSDHGSKKGRHSWDPMLVSMALIGDEEMAGYRTVSGTASVDEQTGANYFASDASGKHKFVIKMRENDYYEKQINSALTRE